MTNCMEILTHVTHLLFPHDSIKNDIKMRIDDEKKQWDSYYKFVIFRKSTRFHVSTIFNKFPSLAYCNEVVIITFKR